MKKLTIGMIVFPEVTLLDFVGPYDVFIRAGCFEVRVIAQNPGTIKAEGGLTIIPELTFAESPDLDILFLPGGKGINPLLTNQDFLSFVSYQGQQAQYITSVCTGSLLLAAAGLLDGYKATTHWRSLELLQLFGVEAVSERVVIDRNRITGGGVTAGIDFGLTLTSIFAGEEVAKTVQLLMEYSPAPPFTSGLPEKAEQNTLQKAKVISEPIFQIRKNLIQSLIG